MGPRFKMNRDHDVCPNITGKLDSLFSVHRNLYRPCWELECGVTQVENGSSDIPLVSNLSQLINIHRVTGKVNYIRLSSSVNPKGISLQNKPSDLSTGEVFTGSPSNSKELSSNGRSHSLPGAKTNNSRAGA
jgi:hypothetical protein